MIATATPEFLLTFVIAAGGVFGLLIGSFLNVVAYRVPAGRSIVTPPSACPGCGSEIKGYDNIPVVSWLLLRGKCRSCHEGISARYPLVELATGVFFVLVAASFMPALLASVTTAVLVGHIIQLVAFLYLAAVSVALALIDIDTHKLPNAIVVPSYLVGGVLLAVAGLLEGNPSALLTAAIGGAAMFVAYLLMAIVYPGGMGFGDVKLAGVLGIYLGFLGFGPLAVGAFGAFLFGGLFAIVLVIARRARRGSGIPFGPWMLAGAWAGIFIGSFVWSGYLSLLGLA